jgi:hypothetical protein
MKKRNPNATEQIKQNQKLSGLKDNDNHTHALGALTAQCIVLTVYHHIPTAPSSEWGTMGETSQR